MSKIALEIAKIVKYSKGIVLDPVISPLGADPYRSCLDVEFQLLSHKLQEEPALKTSSVAAMINRIIPN